MLSLKYLIVLPLLSSLTLGSPFPLPDADPNPDPTASISERATSPKLFTVQAFQSPNPTGSGLTGYYLSSTKSGALVLSSSAPSPPTVLYVDSGAHAYLNTNSPTPVYLDTATGALTAGSSVPNTGLTVPFYHLGTGKTVYTEQNGFATEGAAVFQWIGSQNSAWFACPLAGKPGNYGLVKQMTVVNPDVSNCIAVELSAIDYP